MFFARTQKEHAWKSPLYKFKRRQREAWEALVREAARVAREEEEETDEESDEDMDVDETDQAADDRGAVIQPGHARTRRAMGEHAR
jgi:hypothetical protein